LQTTQEARINNLPKKLMAKCTATPADVLLLYPTSGLRNQ